MSAPLGDCISCSLPLSERGVILTWGCGHTFHLSCLQAEDKVTPVATCALCQTPVDRRAILPLAQPLFGLSMLGPIPDGFIGGSGHMTANDSVASSKDSISSSMSRYLASAPVRAAFGPMSQHGSVSG